MQKAALNFAGFIFLAVAILHVWRLVMKVPVMFGETSVPMALSVFGAGAAFLLALWMFISAKK